MKTLYCGQFPELNRKFIETVSSHRGRDPLAPLTVVIPGQLMRVALRRDLVRAGVSHANVRFTTLNELAHAIMESLLFESGYRVLGDVAGDLIVDRVLQSALPRLDYFKQIATRRGFRRTLLSTLADLRGVGLRPSALIEAAEDRKNLLSKTTRTKLREVAILWAELRDRNEQNRLVDRLGVMERAVEHLQKSSHRLDSVILYGLDELSDLEYRFLDLLRAEDLSIFLPHCSSLAYDWTKDLCKRIMNLGFEKYDLLPDTINHSLLFRLRTAIFDSDIVSRETEPTADKSLFFVSAADTHSECVEAARSVIFPLQTSQSFVILMRLGNSYVDDLRDTFTTAGVQPYFHESRTLGDTPSGSALRNFVRLFNSRWRRADVVDFLNSESLKILPNFGTLKEIPASQWQNYSVLAGISEGKDSWLRELKRLARDWERRQSRLEKEEKEDGTAINYETRLVSLRQFILYLELLMAEMERLWAAKTWIEFIEVLESVFHTFISSDGETASIFEQIEAGNILDAAGVERTPATVTQLVEAALNAPAVREGKFQANDPTIATVQQALGLQFDTVILMGLTERSFPRPSSQDAILLDGEREALSKIFSASGRAVQLPKKSRWMEREKFLFAVTASSARRQLILSFPRMDEKNQREAHSSQFLLDVAEALTGRIMDHEATEKFMLQPGFGRRVSGNPLEAAAAQEPLSSVDYDSGEISRALREKSSSRLHYLLSQTSLRRGLESERSRHEHSTFTRFEGRIENPEVRQTLLEWSQSQPAMAASPLERYWECPFQYFAQRILALEASKDPDDIGTIDKLTAGQLVHKILETHGHNELQRNRSPFAKDALPRLIATADSVLTEYEQNHATGLFMLWATKKRQITEMIRRVHSHEVTQESSYYPLYLEYKIGFEESGGTSPMLSLNGDRVLRLKGKIDRIDAGPQNTLRIIDYKTGKERKAPKGGSLLDIGEFQLHVYILLVEQALAKTVDHAEFQFLEEEKFKSEVLTHLAWKSDFEKFKDVMSTLTEGIQGGKFYPFPHRGCSYCEVRAACGQGRWTQKWDNDNSPDAHYHRLRGEDE